MKSTWELALHLEHFIRAYIPAGWRESIETAMFVPFVAEKDIVAIKGGMIPDKFNKYPFVLAINQWMEEGYGN
jgi:hypothetical protein